MFIKDVLIKSIELNASDVILSPNSFPCIKLYWEIKYLDNDFDFLLREKLDEDILSIMNSVQKEKFLKNLELDFSINLKWYWRFRVNCFKQKDWYWATFRPIKNDIPLFSDLWLPNSIIDLVSKSNWLLLVTWKVWSWKSTTLASILNHINKTQKRHIITIEDPIEFVFDNDKSLIEQREVWDDTLSFDNWLKYSLRQSSDVIMIWEMRDLETFRLALRAAETWNLVLATLHTSWAARSISRIVDMFPWDEKEYIRSQLSESLLWVVWQDLLKTSDWKGRVASIELLVNNTNIQNMIRKWLNHQINSAIETWSEYWMITMKKSLDLLLEKWLINETTFNDYLKKLEKIIY